MIEESFSRFLEIKTKPEIDYTNEKWQELFKGSLFWTAKIICGFKDMNPRTHFPIIKALQDDTLRKLICVPRATFKSSISCVAYPIWLLINNPNLRIYIDSEIYGNSKNFLRQIRQILSSDRFIKVFGSVLVDPCNESELMIRRDVIKKEATLTAGGIGTTKVGQHYDVYILDDPNSPANSNTHEQRKKVIDHYQYAQSIIEREGIFVLIGTRYSDDDLIGWIIKNELGFDSEVKMRDSLNKHLGVYRYEAA